MGCVDGIAFPGGVAPFPTAAAALTQEASTARLVSLFHRPSRKESRGRKARVEGCCLNLRFAAAGCQGECQETLAFLSTVGAAAGCGGGYPGCPVHL